MRLIRYLAGLTPLVMACGDKEGGDTGSSGDEGGYFDEESDADADADTDTDTDGDDTGHDDGFDPEEEDAYIALSPASVSDRVFIANPDRQTLTAISAETYSVTTIPIGPSPAVMAASAPYGTIAILDTVLDEVQLVDAATLEVRAVEVRPNLNQLVLSPDGRWALCYYRASAPNDDDGSSWSYSEISLVDLVAGVDWPQVVGFESSDVQFSEDGQAAVVVSDSWLAHIDLQSDEPRTTRIQFERTDDPPAAEEVLLTPDGRYALIRQFAVSELLLVELSSGQVSSLEAGDNPTDIDVTPDGLHAVAVARGSAEIWRYDLANPLTSPTVLPLPKDAPIVGSVAIAADSTRALLYSTSTGESRFVSWDLVAPGGESPFTSHGLVKPAAAVHLAPDGQTALIVHAEADPEDLDPGSLFEGSPGITLVDMGSAFTNPVRLRSEPGDIEFSDDGRYAVFYQEGEAWLQVADLSRLLVDEYPLPGDPAHIGVLPGSTEAYVSQAHHLGRITFFDPATERTQTITGFELNSSIEQ